MSALSGFQTQQLANLPLVQLAAVCTSVRNTATSYVSHFNKRKRHQRKKEKELPEETICQESLNNVTADLDELGLGHHLPQNWLSECLVPTTKNHWHVSYASSETFFQNKHGFSIENLHSSHYSSTHVLTNLLSNVQLPNKYQTRWIPPSLVQQRRGFKTRRSLPTTPLTTTSLKLAPSLEQGGSGESLESIVQNLSSKQREQLSENVGKALKTEKIQEKERDAFKTGFVEGYLKSQKEIKKSEYYTRWLSMILFSVVVYCFYKLSLVARVSISTAQVDAMNVKNVSFDDVRGVEEAKQELKDVVSFLQDPEMYTSLGGKLPKGVLLAGPPGTGKTLLARAVAGEADVPFFYASGSEFDNMFVGSGARRVRELFAEAKANTPCVVFIDELDSIGGKRVDSPLHPYSRQTINQLLSEMDGFKQNEGVIVIGATNFVGALDHALTRPGRFDMSVNVPIPDVRGRVDILKLYLGKVKVSPDVKPEMLARGTVGFTGADLENLVNQAALKAAGDKKQIIDMVDLEFAKDKILMGPERKSARVDLKNRKITAYHEGGHALVAFYTKDAVDINKVTIMPRGRSLGHVSLLPDSDQWHLTKSQLLASLDISMGGRAAEELVFGPDVVTTGAWSDFESATNIARNMVTKYGMSEKLGLVTYDDQKTQSPETEAMIESEVRSLLKDSYERAKNLLKTHSREHHKLAEALLIHETLSSDEVTSIIHGKAI